MNSSFDVVVLGGGPCGLAAATALAMCGRSVGVFERNRFGGPRVGETFGPEILSSLRDLGIVDDFVALDKIPFRGVQSAWGSDELFDRPSIVHPLGEGFHVDRALFDELLARRARALGAKLCDDMGVATIESNAIGWRLSWPNGMEAEARYIVDASGRGAPGGARGFLERHWIACDRAVGIVTRLSPPDGRELAPELLIETAEQGWWYAVPQPGPVLLCVVMTDADLIGVGNRAELPSQWRALLERTHHLRALCAGAALVEAPRIVRADTGFLLPNYGHRWRAVGDAAFASDPLSGDGIVRGVAGAIETARKIDDALARKPVETNESTGPMDKRIPAYLDRRMQYYRMEKRWPDALFWKRRRGIDWQSTAVTLDPRTVLRSDGRDPEVDHVAAIEGLLPPRAIRTMLERLRKPCPAHEALGALRTVAPLGDKRLLVGLQELVARGILRTD